MILSKKVFFEETGSDNDCIALGILMAEDFELFLSFFFFYMNGMEDGDEKRKQGSNFIIKGFHKRIIDVLVKYANGENEKKNLIINVPPRSAKTTLLTYYSAWCYVRNPRSKIIYTSYADNLATDVSERVRSIIESNLFQRCFSLIRLNPKKNSKDNWGIDGYDGEMYAAPMGGRITGFGAGVLGASEFSGFLAIDDPLKVADVGSEIERRRKIDYYCETLKNRLNNPKTPIIIIMQRLHVEDLCGYIESTPEEMEDYEIMRIAACNEDGFDSIWPEQWNDSFFRKLKESRPWYFASQYLQEPVVRGGEVIKTEWFNIYSHLEGIKFKRMFIVADTASKTKEANDYSVFMLCGIDTYGNLYIIDILRGKWEADVLVQKACSFWTRWRHGVGGCYCGGFFVEEKSSGIMLVQLLMNKTGIPVIPIKSTKDKLTRVSLCLDFLAAKKVHLPDRDPVILNNFISECEGFTRSGTAAHDDQVDCLAYAVSIANNSFGIPCGAIL